MYSWFKNNIVWLIIISCLILIIFVQNQQDNSNTKADIILKPTVQYTYKGNNHAQIPVQVVESDKQLKPFKKDIKDKNIKITDVTVFTQNTTIEKDSIKGIVKDSIVYFNDSDNYRKLSVKYNLTTNTGYYLYTSVDTLTYTKYIKKRFLKSDSVKIDIKNADDATKIMYGTSISLKQSKPIVSLVAVVGLNPIQMQPFWGIGIGIPIFSIKTK